MKNNNQIGQELPEFKPVESVGCENEEAGNPCVPTYGVVHIKQMLIENPEHIVELLERFEFCHIHLKRNEIRFARNEEGGQNISIRLEDNPSIYVKDFVTNENGDIIAYIMKSRSVKFIEVLAEIKSVLGLEDDWEPPKRDMLFGGFYDRIGEDRRAAEDHTD